MESISEDHTCPICWEVLIYPVSTKCKHIYCSQCIHSYLLAAKQKCCPMCRTQLIMQRFNPPVIKKLWDSLQRKYPEEIELKKPAHDAYLAEHRRQKDIKNSIKIHFNYGYILHTPYSPHKTISQKDVSLYISLKDSKINENSLIQKVDFKIETPPRARLRKYSPFTTTMKKVYTGNSEETPTEPIPAFIKVTWQRWTKLPPSTYTLGLDLTGIEENYLEIEPGLGATKNFQSSDFVYVHKTLTKKILDKRY
ncbi:unnamed protein product [Moneuplotes crassus]|uniref:RING-type E3 ubiquitin transferase n=1 Tax=Euplotes crassus TaxID=5936 RepID=A0AAD1XRD2_EUPCR|nr:unnamed protein product [Moneuplotes crassus]